MDEFDVVVAGGGIAALTAGLFSARHGRSTLVLTGGVVGGQIVTITTVEDFPGFPEGVPGYELGPLVQEQAAAAGADFRMASIEGLARAAKRWTVQTSEGPVAARVVVAATGSRFRRLGLPGEEELYGRGISNCASCDGPLARGRTVGVVGGGDSALQETLELTEHAGRVLLFNAEEKFEAQATYQRRVLDSPVVEVRPRTAIEEVLGDGTLSGVRVRDLASGTVEEIELAALFVFVGLEPSTDFLHGVVELDADGRVATDGWMRTSEPGLFAAGDIRTESVRQAVAAAGDGATAAVAAHRYLRA